MGFWGVSCGLCVQCLCFFFSLLMLMINRAEQRLISHKKCETEFFFMDFQVACKNFVRKKKISPTCVLRVNTVNTRGTFVDPGVMP